jgi:hypothetical protein
MSTAASFLAGAKGRLLPAAIPFRFFAVGVVFHVLMWLALLTAASQVVSFRGGLGPALGAIHLLTLGVMITVAIGASAQLLPVATRRALAAVWPIRLVFWLTVPGLAALVAGMYLAQIWLLLPAAIATSAGLLVFAIITADNLRRASSMPVVAAYGWVALAALVVLIGLGLALVSNYDRGWLPDHASVGLAHMIMGGFGFMGLLVLGFSHVLVPMFALSSNPSPQASYLGFVLAAAAVFLGGASALFGDRIGLTLAGLLGIAAAATHVWLMQQTLAAGMRKRLGLSFVLIRASWLMLPLTVLVGLAALHDNAGPNGATLFGALLIGGWLLTFLMGVLQRILPFLASMHTAKGGAPMMMSEIAASEPLRVHALCHGLGMTLLLAAIAGDVVWLAQVGSGIGLVGALAFAWFAARILGRVVAAQRA